MPGKQQVAKKSAFTEIGFSESILELMTEIRTLYLSDEVPWVIGYSGGKDSTAALQLIWIAIRELEPDQRQKPIHVISTDTLVENPIVAAWVNGSLTKMTEAAKEQGMPIQAHRLTPKITDTFWVNLIGRGYPAPRYKFRWCTERLKIQPSNTFIRSTVQQSGEAILVLGMRKAESTRRSKVMSNHAKKAVAARLTPNSALHNCLVYTPIEDWTNDDVWFYINRVKNPWGHNNKDLLSMYRGASADNECPLVVETNTPSCGTSRFGCWVCTLVDEDKSMAAMIQNDQEKEWMQPLLDLRKEFDFSSTDQARKTERSRRDFRRITGHLTLYTNKDGDTTLVHGPYKQETRAYWLQRVLEVQHWIRESGPKSMREMTLITEDELEEIRRIWVTEKHEVEDALPQIYKEAFGTPYPYDSNGRNPILNAKSLGILKEICGEDELHYQMVRNLLSIEYQYRAKHLRRGIFDKLQSEIERCFFTGEEDALEFAKQQQLARQGQLVESMDDETEKSKKAAANRKAGVGQ